MRRARTTRRSCAPADAHLPRAGGDLTLYSFPDLAVLSTFASQTRGSATLFALSTEVHHPAAHGVAPGIPEIHTTLALACKRRLLVLSWVDGTWCPQLEVPLPHQIRGMAFDQRRLVCGFSTGEYGVVTLPPLDGDGTAPLKAQPVLGDLFSLPLALPDRPSRASVPGLGGLSSGLSGLGGLGNVVSLGALNALAKKLDKNGVVGVPRPAAAASRKGKLPQRGGARDREDDTAWLWGEEWGWEHESRVEGGEVFVVRDSASNVLLNIPEPAAELTSLLARRHRHAPPVERQAPTAAVGRPPDALDHAPCAHRRGPRRPALRRLAPVPLGRPLAFLLNRPDTRRPRARYARARAERICPSLVGLAARLARRLVARRARQVDPGQAADRRPPPHRLELDAETAAPCPHGDDDGGRRADEHGGRD